MSSCCCVLHCVEYVETSSNAKVLSIFCFTRHKKELIHDYLVCLRSNNFRININIIIKHKVKNYWREKP